jgi:probable phosphoglycerate mutase
MIATPVSTRLFFIRHGATSLSAEDRFAGATDVPLSEEGRDQVRRLSERLAGNAVAAIYASPLDRTMETARILAGPHGLAVQPLDGIREIAHGRWEGLTRAEVERQFGDEYVRWEDDPYTFAPEGGESGVAVMARALPDILRIVRAHAGEQIIAVSHKATIRLVISSLIGFDARTYRDRLDQSLAALNILDFNERAQARLTLFNDCSHYSRNEGLTPAVPKRRLSKDW